MKRTSKLSSLSCAIALIGALPGYAQTATLAQPAEGSHGTQQSQGDNNSSALRDAAGVEVRNSVPVRINKARDLVGMQIRNQQDEKLGKVKDVVLDLQSGRVAYVVLSTGGFRPKLVALPPSAFTASPEEKWLVLNADKEKVKQAAGFSKNHWPNMVTPSWGAESFWQTPDGKSPEIRGYDKNLELDKNPSVYRNKVEEPSPLPTPTPPDQIVK